MMPPADDQPTGKLLTTIAHESPVAEGLPLASAPVNQCGRCRSTQSISRSRWRAPIIPVLAVPLSIVGAFGGTYLLGFSINLLTLFGLILAIGIVVDDPIIVLENVEGIISTEGESAREASIQAMEEVSGPVIAIILVLCAVFVPVSLAVSWASFIDNSLLASRSRS